MYRVSLIALLLLVLSPLTQAQFSTPVRIVEQPVTVQRSKLPMNADVQVALETGLFNSGTDEVFRVPAGQRYVIETVSVWSFATECEFFAKPVIVVTAGGEQSEFRLPIPDSSALRSGNLYAHNGTWPIKLYADPGSSVRAGIIRTAAHCPTVFRFSLAGYLEADE